MNHAHEDLPAFLYAAYVDEEEQYARALRTAREASACGVGEGFDERLRQVFTLLEAIAARDAVLADTKQRWEQEGRPTNDALRGVMERIADLIRCLSRELQTVESAVRARRDHLADELDVCNRRRQMQRAYLRKS
jgi:hypothetical protein